VSLRDAEGAPVEVEEVVCSCGSLGWEKAAGRFGPASATFDLTLADEASGELEFPLEARLKVVSPCEQEVPIQLMAPHGSRASS